MVLRLEFRAFFPVMQNWLNNLFMVIIPHLQFFFYSATCNIPRYVFFSYQITDWKKIVQLYSKENQFSKIVVKYREKIGKFHIAYFSPFLSVSVQNLQFLKL